MDLGERAWLMREALERARRDLLFLGSLAHVTSEQPLEVLQVDVGLAVRWIDCVLDGLDPLEVDPSAEPPAQPIDE